MTALADYYAAQANEQNARVPLLQAQTAQTRTQTGEIADNDLATRTATLGRANLDNSAAGLNAANARNVDPDDAAKRALDMAQAGYQGSLANMYTAKLPGELTAQGLSNQGVALSNAQAPEKFASDLATASVGRTRDGFTVDPNSPLGMYILSGKMPAKPAAGTSGVGYQKGGEVKASGGPKAGPKDTVSAMLQPGEVVMNVGAVHHYGKALLDHMNEMGLMRSKAHKEMVGHVKKAMKPANGNAKAA